MPSPRERTPEHRLILLRTPVHPPEQDPYRLALKRNPHAASWTLHPVQVLDTQLVNQPELQDAVRDVHRNGENPPYDGVVITSARSVEAYRTALAALPSPLPPPRIPFFVVGRPTAAALLALPSAPDPALVLGAAESGTGARLAQFILAHFASLPPPSNRREPKLLYLTGDKNSDTVPNVLAHGGVHAHELQVYATTPAASFPAALERELAAVPREGEGQVWVVLLSPSGAREALPVLRALGALPPPGGDAPATGPLAHLAPRVRLASIGSVTASYLSSVGVEGDAMASRPEPDALVREVVDTWMMEEHERRRLSTLESGEAQGEGRAGRQ
ncbi:uroporphyrinogen-III synthase [Rhodotorula kratochvilovae]